MYAELQSQINDPVAIAQNDITISQDLLIKRSLKLCDIFKYEFIFCKPCQELERIVKETIENLSYMDIITLEEVLYTNIITTLTKHYSCKLFDRNVVWKRSYGAEDMHKRLMIVQMKNILTRIGLKLFNTK